ncbi:MAG: sigma-70 family RNA polymerase sigma factor [Myxococcales bacterium]|nr:sigma-70 family RNA polymerase sigma factor [Myxococcales bacterium]
MSSFDRGALWDEPRGYDGPPLVDALGHASEVDAFDADAAGLAPSAPSLPLPSLEDVFNEHADHVGNSLRRLGVRDADVPDLVQEVFVVVHRILPDYDPERPMWPWLFGIVYRTAAAYRRKAYREVLDDGSVAGERHDSSQNLDEAMRRADERRLVLEALQHVELGRRAVFVMSEIDGVAIPEVAAALGIGLNTAYSRLRLAREEFRAAVVRITKTQSHTAMVAATNGGAR